MPAASLDILQKQISHQESELQRLRQELEDRQSQLAVLTDRKCGLEAQLRQVEVEIARVTAGRFKTRLTSAKRTSKMSASAKRASGRPSLPRMIVELVKEAAQPVTVRQLVATLRRRGYRSASDKFPKMVGVRVYELRRKGILRHASDQSGYLLGKLPNGRVTTSTKSEASPKTTLSKQTAKVATQSAHKQVSNKTKRAPKNGQPTLQEVLTSLLCKSKRPLTGAELAEQAQAVGYRSNSRDFRQVVWVMLSRMDNIENVPGKGYRLKPGGEDK
jgi:hypothetical protein